MPSRSGTTSSRSRRAEPARETPAIERFGRIDVLVTLIGGSRGNPGIEAGNDDWDAVLAANLRSAVTMTGLVIPSMKERRRGVIVHVASILGRAARLRAHPAPLGTELVAVTRGRAWCMGTRCR